MAIRIQHYFSQLQMIILRYIITISDRLIKLNDNSDHIVTRLIFVFSVQQYNGTSNQHEDTQKKNSPPRPSR